MRLMYASFARLDQMSVVNEKTVLDDIAVAIVVSIFLRTFDAISGMMEVRNVFSPGILYLSREQRFNAYVCCYHVNYILR